MGASGATADDGFYLPASVGSTGARLNPAIAERLDFSGARRYVTIPDHKSEMGQSILTGLALLAPNEDWNAIGKMRTPPLKAKGENSKERPVG